MNYLQAILSWQSHHLFLIFVCCIFSGICTLSFLRYRFHRVDEIVRYNHPYLVFNALMGGALFFALVCVGTGGSLLYLLFNLK